MASSTPLRFCSLRKLAWAVIPVVLRFQVFSLMWLLRGVVLTLLPFLRGIFALVLLTFRHDMSLFEESNSRTDTFIEVFLVDFDPMNIPCPFPNLNAFKNLLFVCFERGEVVWGKRIRWAMETREFHALAHNLGGFQTRTKCHLHILPVFPYPLWIKHIRACHRQLFLPRNKLRFAIVELNNSLLDRLFPLGAHRLVQNFSINAGHFTTCLGHPLLHHDERHPVVEKLNSFWVPKGMDPKMGDSSTFVLNLILF